MHQRPPTVDQHTSLGAAWLRLRGPEHRHLVVIDAGVHPVGLFNERDLALAWPPGPRGAQHVSLDRLLTGRLTPQVHAGDDLATVARRMLVENTDALVVVDDDGRLVGLVTARHCLRSHTHPGPMPA